MEITRRYATAFFDLHLRGRAQPLLDGPASRYSEVKHSSAEAKTCR